MALAGRLVDGCRFASCGVAALFAAALAVATPAFAQPATPKQTWSIDPVPPGAVIVKGGAFSPESLPNNIGPALERRALANGASAVDAKRLALAGGSVGIASGLGLLLYNGWEGAVSGFRNSIPSAIGGCVAGGIAGAVGGGSVTLGAAAIPGYAVGCGIGFVSTVIGMTAQGAITCVTQDCSVKVQRPADISTGDANWHGNGVSMLNGGGTPGANAALALNFTTGTPTQAQFESALIQVGLNHSFLCQTSANGFQLCFFYYSSPADNDTFGVRVRASDQFATTTFKFCAGSYRGNSCPSNIELFSPKTSATTPAGAGNWTSIGCQNANKSAASDSYPCLMIGNKVLDGNNGLPPAVISTTWKPVVGVPLWGLPWTGMVDNQTLAKPMNDALLAAMANEAWKYAVQQDGTLPAYNGAAPVTANDLAAARAVTGAPPTRLGDVIAAPPMRSGQSSIPAGTLSGGLTQPPQQVQVVGGGTGTGSSAGNGSSETKPDTDLGDDSSLLGDPFQPARDFLTSTFSPYLNPSFELPSGVTCPVVTIDLPKLLGKSIGRPDLSVPVNNGFVCDWLEQQRAVFFAVLHMVWMLGGLVIVLRNS